MKFKVKKIAGFNYSKISFPVNVGVISAVEEKGELLLEKLGQKLDIIFDSMIALQEDVKLKDRRIMELQNSLAARDRKIEEIEHRLEDRLEKVERQVGDNPYCYQCGYRTDWDMADPACWPSGAQWPAGRSFMIEFWISFKMEFGFSVLVLF